MTEIRNTTADMNAPGSPDMLVFLLSGMDGETDRFIQNQERAGQQQLVRSEMLKELQPHRKTCRFYVGPVEHSKTGGGHQMLTHWATHCTCGKSYDAERYDECPNSAEAWRGPKPEDVP